MDIKELQRRAGIIKEQGYVPASFDGKVEVQRQTRITGINLSADDWQLYTRKKGADGVAKQLNEGFQTVVNSGKSREEVRSWMGKLMTRLRGWGADDTEPHYVLRDLLDHIYGK